MFEVKPIIIKRQNSGQLDFIDSLDFNYITHNVYEYGKVINTPKMSIGVLGYKNLEKTKVCVESVLKYVKDIDYELLLVDNGSEDEDELYNYYQSVPTTRKKILKVETPIGRTYGSIYGIELMYKYSTGDYFVFLGNDNIITENALQNMITCLDSDCNIALVTPMSSNVWMMQNPCITYSNLDEMFEVAKHFNVSDPRKWQERMTIATVATAVKREAIDRVGFFDFMCELNLCKRLRMSGYKTILLGDTWVCHDHDESKFSHSWVGKDDVAKYQSNVIDELRKKELGVDLFEEMLVFQLELTNMFETDNISGKIPNILSIDVYCGQGMLDLKNKLRGNGVFQTNSVAYTTNAKYYKWLETVADEVVCDRIEYIAEALENCKFDYIIIGEPINLYNEPIKFLKKVLNLLNKNGQLVLKVRNTLDVNTFMNIINKLKSVDGEMPIHVTVSDIINCVKYMGYTNIELSKEYYAVDDDMTNQFTKIFFNMNIENLNIRESLDDMVTKNYIVYIKNC